MMNPETKFHYDLSSITDHLFLGEVLASRLDFSRHSFPQSSNLKPIFQNYQRNPKAARQLFRLKLGIDGSVCFVFALKNFPSFLNMFVCVSTRGS